MWRDSGSSVSSQWMSTSSPRFSAISQSAFRLVAPVRHRALEMRNAADHVDALVERALEVLRGVRRAEIAVLREGDELQVDIGRDPSSSPRAARRRRSAGRRRCRHACGWRAGPSTRRGRNSGARAPSPPRRSGAASARPRARCLRAACRTRSSAAGRATASRPCGNGSRRKAARRAGPSRRSRGPASAAMFGSIAAIFPPAQAMSTPVRPSGSVAFLTIRSKVMRRLHEHTVSPGGRGCRSAGTGERRGVAREFVIARPSSAASRPPPPCGEEARSSRSAAITAPPCGTARAARRARGRCARRAPWRRWS